MQQGSLQLRVRPFMPRSGREFCGRPDRHPYELFLQLEEIEHRTTRVKRPQSNGIVERLHRTLLDERFGRTLRRGGPDGRGTPAVRDVHVAKPAREAADTADQRSLHAPEGD